MFYVITVSRFTLGLIFLYSSISKLRNFTAFPQAIQNFQILPPNLVRPAALAFMLGEILIVMSMVLGRNWFILGYGLSIILLMVFIYALNSVLRRKLQTICNCFGNTDQKISNYDVWRNIGIILVALLGLATSIVDTGQANPTLFDWLLSDTVAMVLSILLLNLSDILELVA